LKLKEREANYKQLEKAVTEQKGTLGMIIDEIQPSPKSEGAGSFRRKFTQSIKVPFSY